jgi:hypothetical protein
MPGMFEIVSHFEFFFKTALQKLVLFPATGVKIPT